MLSVLSVFMEFSLILSITEQQMFQLWHGVRNEMVNQL